MEEFFKALQNIYTQVSGFLEQVASAVGQIPENVKIVASDLMARISKGIELVKREGMQAAESVIKAVQQGAENLRQIVGSVIQGVGNAIANTVTVAYNTVKDAIERISKNMEESKNWATYYTEGGLSDLEDNLNTVKTTYTVAVPDYLSRSTNTVNEQKETTIVNVHQVLNEIDKQTYVTKENYVREIEKQVERIHDVLGDINLNVNLDISTFLGDVKDRLSDIYNSVSGSLSGLFKEITPGLETIAGFFTGLRDWVMGLFTQFFEIKPEDILDFQEQYQKLLLERYVGGVR
jgi:predicted PurR-regulated permease PerM